jgi:DNA-binding MarR family transcriptional regulator
VLRRTAPDRSVDCTRYARINNAAATVTTVNEQVLTGDVIRRLLYRRDVALARHRAALARSLGLTDVEMLVLVHLQEQEALAPAQIARLLDLSSGGATALVQRLERAGHVTRRPHPTDRRSTLIELSEQTANRLATAQIPMVKGLEQAIAPLVESERSVVARFFGDLAVLSEALDGTAHAEDAPAAPKPKLRAVPSLWA